MNCNLIKFITLSAAYLALGTGVVGSSAKAAPDKRASATMAENKSMPTTSATKPTA